MQAKSTEGEFTRQYILQKSYVHKTFCFCSDVGSPSLGLTVVFSFSLGATQG